MPTVTKYIQPILQWSYMSIVQPFNINKVIKSIIDVFAISCKFQIQLSFGFLNMIYKFSGNVFNLSGRNLDQDSKFV